MVDEPMSFLEWIACFKDVDLPFGDLAYDIVRSKDFPKENNFDAIFHYVKWKTADENILNMLRAAWDFYIATR